MSVLLRSPSLRIESNPLEFGLAGGAKKSENLAGAVPIAKVELDNIIKLLKIMSSNDDRLSYLQEEKLPFLFNSLQLKELLELTPSVKTRLAMIVMLGPRLLDPRAKVDYFMELFRFSEEKEKVQEVLKARTHVLSSSLFRQSGLSLSPIGGFFGSEEHAAAKPFIGIKGMAQARERVLKVPVKGRKSILPSGVVPVATIPEHPPVKESLADRRSNSAPRNNIPDLPKSPVLTVSAHSSSPNLAALSPPKIIPNKIISELEFLETELSDEDGYSDDNTIELIKSPKITPPKPILRVEVSVVLPVTPRVEPLGGMGAQGATVAQGAAGGTAAHVMAVKRNSLTSAMIPLSRKNGTHANGQTPTRRSSKVSISVAPMTPPADSSSQSEFGSSGKVKRMIKSLISRRFSPKYTPMAEGGNLIAAEDKSSMSQSQYKLQTELRLASIISRSSSDKKFGWGDDVSNGNGDGNGNGTNGHGEKKGKKTITFPDQMCPLTPERDLMVNTARQPPLTSDESGTYSTPYSPIDNGIDIFASTEIARTWRKSTRFVNVKSLAYDFDRLKERGERRQRLRSQTPDRRQFSMRLIEVAEGVEEKEEPPAEPWYISDKVSENKPKRRVTAVPAQITAAVTQFNVRRKSANQIAERAGNCTPGGTPIIVAMSRDLSLYQNMPVEGPVDQDEEGNPLYRYYELVRMNVVKKYTGVKQTDLENYMIDADFENHFGMSKDEFKYQPLWRKVQKKKSLLLF